MIKRRRMLCDRCGADVDDDGAKLTIDGPGMWEWVDLCAECWREFKDYLKRRPNE